MLCLIGQALAYEGVAGIVVAAAITVAAAINVAFADFCDEATFLDTTSNCLCCLITNCSKKKSCVPVLGWSARGYLGACIPLSTYPTVKFCKI